MIESRARYLLDIANRAFARMSPWLKLSQDICENYYPVRADYTSTIDYDDFAGILSDGTPVHAHETLSNAIDAMLRQGDWFSASTGDEEIDKRPAMAAGLKRITQVMRKNIFDKRANFKMATDEADKDWTSVGVNVISVEETMARDSILFRAWHPRDVAYLTNEDGVVDTVFRKCRFTARDIKRRVDRGSWSNMSSEIARCAQYEPEKEFPFMHCLVPVDMLYGDSFADLKRIRHPWLSVYLDVSATSIMREAGAPVFNYVVSRLRTLSDKPWGFSPYTLNALQDARMLQDMALVILEQGQKAVDPPVVLSSSVFSRDFNAFAGGVTEADLEADQKLGDAMQVLDTGQRINVGLELKADVRALIAESMLLNKLMLPSLREMREVEVMVRTEEFRRAALPFFAPISTAYHERLLSTALEMLFNMRRITPDILPRELQGRDVTYTFQSPLDEAEGRKTVEAFFSQTQILAASAEIDPTIANIWDGRKAAEGALVATGKPEWLIPEGPKRKAKDDEAAQKRQLQDLASQAREGAGAIADMSNAAIATQNAGMA